MLAEYFRALFTHKVNLIIAKVTRGSAMLNISGVKDLKEMPFEIPSIAEQEAIISKLDEELTVVSEAEKDVDKNLRRAERLRQSILKKAFSGKLVPRERGDELAISFSKAIKKTYA